MRHNPEGSPWDSGDDGGGREGPDESDDCTPVESDHDRRPPHKPAGDPDPDGHHGRDPRLYKSMTINKWAKPIPKLDLPPRIHTQKASKIKQIWETCCIQVALALSTWNSLAVPYWSDIYGQAERDYEKWCKSTMNARYKHETRFLYGRKAPISPNCNAIEADSHGHYARLYIFSCNSTDGSERSFPMRMRHTLIWWKSFKAYLRNHPRLCTHLQLG